MLYNEETERLVESLFVYRQNRRGQSVPVMTSAWTQPALHASVNTLLMGRLSSHDLPRHPDVERVLDNTAVTSGVMVDMPSLSRGWEDRLGRAAVRLCRAFDAFTRNQNASASRGIREAELGIIPVSLAEETIRHALPANQQHMVPDLLDQFLTRFLSPEFAATLKRKDASAMPAIAEVMAQEGYVLAHRLGGRWGSLPARYRPRDAVNDPDLPAGPSISVMGGVPSPGSMNYSDFPIGWLAKVLRSQITAIYREGVDPYRSFDRSDAARMMLEPALLMNLPLDVMGKGTNASAVTSVLLGIGSDHLPSDSVMRSATPRYPQGRLSRAGAWLIDAGLRGNCSQDCRIRFPFFREKKIQSRVGARRVASKSCLPDDPVAMDWYDFRVNGKPPEFLSGSQADLNAGMAQWQSVLAGLYGDELGRSLILSAGMDMLSMRGEENGSQSARARVALWLMEREEERIDRDGLSMSPRSVTDADHALARCLCPYAASQDIVSYRPGFGEGVNLFGSSWELKNHSPANLSMMVMDLGFPDDADKVGVASFLAKHAVAVSPLFRLHPAIKQGVGTEGLQRIVESMTPEEKARFADSAPLKNLVDFLESGNLDGSLAPHVKLMMGTLFTVPSASVRPLRRAGVK